MVAVAVVVAARRRREVAVWLWLWRCVGGEFDPPHTVWTWCRSLPIEMKLKPFSKNSPTRSVPNRNRPRVMPFFLAFVIWARGHGALRGDGRGGL